MQATNFKYDGIYLSDFGFIMCRIGSDGGLSDEPGGSIITFNKAAHHYGKRFSLSSTQYDECVTATFDICKDPDSNVDIAISPDEYRQLFRWLNRRQFHKLQFVDECGDDSSTFWYYNASFNINKIIIDDVIYGLRLQMETDRPYAYGEDSINKIVSAGTSAKVYNVNYVSDEIDSIVPTLTIKCKSSGNLAVYNLTNGSFTSVKNCVNNEVITIDGFTHLITSSVSGHDVANDFSYSFFKLSNTYSESKNSLYTSIPCELTITYTPAIKLTV